jgi:hypothetical protein
MCHDWWWRRLQEEREASRELWDEFERTRPLSGPEPNREDAEVTLEQPEPKPVTAQH